MGGHSLKIRRFSLTNNSFPSLLPEADSNEFSDGGKKEVTSTGEGLSALGSSSFPPPEKRLQLFQCQVAVGTTDDDVVILSDSSYPGVFPFRVFESSVQG